MTFNENLESILKETNYLKNSNYIYQSTTHNNKKIDDISRNKYLNEAYIYYEKTK